MTRPPIPTDLTEALSMSQRFGALGAGSIEAVVDHARVFVVALEGISGTVIDLGTGGGVPGLVIATDRPDLSVILVDRRQARTDLCARLVARLGLADQVRVIHADARELIDRSDVGLVDAVVARGFGDPSTTVEHAVPLIVPGGIIVISEPPTGDRWDDTMLAAQGVSRRGWVHAPVYDASGRAGRAIVLRRHDS